jgi:hypothetical protein
MRKTLKEQRISRELEEIIEEFGHAMRNANKEYIAQPPSCPHDEYLRITPRMKTIWELYTDFCRRNPDA